MCACSRAAIPWACAAFRSAEGDRVISLAILRHIEAESGERAAYLKMRRAVAGEAGGREARPTATETGRRAEEANEDGAGSSSRSGALCRDVGGGGDHPDVSANGYGKRTSSYEYRITGRGGKGIVAMAVNQRNGPLVASLPVEDSDEIMLVTDGGQLIRCPVEGIRVAGRGTQGVIVFKTAEGERVVSVERISEEEAAENGESEPGEAASE